MALSSLNTNWIKGSYAADRDFLLKVAENDPLRLGDALHGGLANRLPHGAALQGSIPYRHDDHPPLKRAA